MIRPTDEAKVRFMDEGRGLERPPRRFLGHLLGSQISEFLID
jgi:hypothetical protein